MVTGGRAAFRMGEKKMKLSDYIADFLAKKGIRHVFAITGGASVHLIQSIADTPGITFVCPQHEQGGAMAADAYARVTGRPGVAIATSGPGATNMITGICCAYYDSVPVIYITGQVSTFRLRGKSGVRQLGFQETDTVDICKPVTKYAARVDDPAKIRYELEKAFFIATSERPGPVLLDIPDNVQRMEIEPDSLESFVSEENILESFDIDHQIDECIHLINMSQRPILILGWGIRLAKAEEEVRELIDILKFPVAPTWAMIDFLPSDNPLLVGSFGTHGTRYGNFAVQNADLIFSIGARLDTREAGTPLTSFGRGAKKIIVDIDKNELNKFKMLGMDVDVLVNKDARQFIKAVNIRGKDILPQNIDVWKRKILFWKEKYPICERQYLEQEEVNPYVFVKALSQISKEGDVIFVDTGCTLAWMMQAFECKPNQRLFHDFNFTSMGYALPASIGACFAHDDKPITCVTGDGSLQMNIQELATVIRHRLPIKIFLINNHGYSMIQQTQDQWLDSRYLASTTEGGLGFPDFLKVADAYGFKTVMIDSNKSIVERLREVFNWKGPVFCNVEISAKHKVIPQVKYGRPIEDAEPLLERKEFLDCMIIKPDDASLE